MPQAAQPESLLIACSRYLQNRAIPLFIVTDWASKLYQRLQTTPAIRPNKIARLLQMEPCISAHLIQLANSPLYKGRRTINSAAGALAHLGINTTQNLVSALIAKALYQIQNPLIHKHLQEWWEHSSQVAIISGLLAQKTPGFDPDHAFMAGLLHDIGLVPILIYADAHFAGNDLAELDDTLKQLRVPLGLEIARRWHLPANFAEVIAGAEDWQQNQAYDATYSDLIMIAQLHSFIGKPKAKYMPKMDELPAYRKIAAGKLDIKLSIQILDQAREEMQFLKSLLHSEF